MRAMISIENVSKSFPTKGAGTFTALDGVSMQIRDREFFTLLGPSGCGKTTLLRIIAGFELPSSGTVRIEGADSSCLPPQRRPVNTVFQSYALFPHMTVAENVAFGLQMQKVARLEREARVSEALRLVRLEAWPRDCRVSSPAVSSSALRWLAPWRLARRCCCWMSR